MKLVKLLGIALAIISFSAFPLSAQNTDEQIKQLEKELRLLELQKQVEQAKQGKSAQQPQATQAKASNSQTQSKRESLCGNQYTMTSCYFGFELGATIGSSATYNGTDKYSGVIVSKTDPNTGSYVAITAQFIGGYQWYFHEKMGLGINALLGYGGTLSLITDTSTFSYSAITWGADVKYLVDFTSIVGMSLGVGFEMSHFVYSDAEVPTSGAAHAPAFTAGVGIHFNSTNLKHRFSINYKYRLYKNTTISTNDYTKILVKHGGVGLISLSYMYRL